MLREIPCTHCGGAGLELQHDGRSVCRFCGTPNVMAGPICPRCERVNPAGATQCEVCGQSLVRACPSCQTKNWTGAEQCANCGRKLDTLDFVIARKAEGTAGHLDRLQREATSLKAQEAADSERRLAYFEEIERKRQQALAEARVKAARERRVLTVVFIGVLLFGAVLVVAFVLSSLAR